MKTVIDAVNEFKGETDGNYIYVGSGSNDINKGNLQETYATIHNEKWYLLCTSGQFKDLVSQMETNFGKCSDVAVSHWKKCTKELLTKSTKELEVMDIDWSKAPEGATHYAEESEDDVARWIKQDHDHGLSYVAAWLHEKRGKDAVVYWNSPGDFILIDCVAKPQPPIYTQAMDDNGELPPIGSKVQFVGNDDYLVEFSIVNGDEIECICHTTDFEGESIGVYRHKDGYSVSILTQLVESITPPIELIDGKAYQFDYNEKKSIHCIYVESGNVFLSSMGSYCPDGDCTNIQPLTVEVK